MSDQITTAFSKQYSAAVTLLAQQEMSRLRMCVTTAPQVGEFQFHDQVGSTTARKRTVRHADSPYIPTPHSRKGVKMYDWDWGDYIDRQDQVKTLIDPTNPYTRAGGAALGRAMDSEIIAAFDGNAITDDGGTTVTFVNDGGTTRSLAGALNKAEILGIREQFYANDVDDGEFYMAIASSQVTDLLNIKSGRIGGLQRPEAAGRGEGRKLDGVQLRPCERFPAAEERHDPIHLRLGEERDAPGPRASR